MLRDQARMQRPAEARDYDLHAFRRAVVCFRGVHGASSFPSARTLWAWCENLPVAPIRRNATIAAIIGELDREGTR